MRLLTLDDVVVQLSPIILRKVLEELQAFLTREKLESSVEYELQDVLITNATEEELRHSFIRAYSNDQLLMVLLDRLHPYEQAVLHHFLYQVGGDLLTYRQVEQGRYSLKPQQFRLGITGLRRKGFVYTLRRQWGEVAYLMPTDLEQRIYPLQRNSLRGYREPKDQISPLRVMELGRDTSVLSDLFIVLDNIRSLPQGKASLTKKGTLHKRIIRMWQEKCKERDQAFSRAVTPPLVDRVAYSPYIAFLLDFMTKNNLIHWYSEYMCIEEREVQQWMSLSRNEMTDRLISYWSTEWLHGEPWLRRYQKDMALFRPTDWTPFLSLLESWKEQYELPAVEEAIARIDTELVSPLYQLGLIEKGETDQGECVWRWVDVVEDTDPKLWVQPNMELFCSGRTPFCVLWEVSKCCAVQQWGSMIVMRCSQDRVSYYIEQGEAVEDWIGMLQTYSSVTLPATLLEQLRGWEKSQQKVTLEDVTLIEVSEKSLIEACVQWSELQALGVKRIAERLLAVPVQHKELVKQAFLKKGIQPTQIHREEQVSSIPVRKVFFQATQEERLALQVESVFPELTDALPHWSTLPDMWKKQCTAYHDQTKREIIVKAIDHYFKLRIEHVLDGRKEFFPVECKVENGEWVCYDQNHKYKVSDIRKLQLLFPI